MWCTPCVDEFQGSFEGLAVVDEDLAEGTYLCDLTDNICM